MKRDIKLFLEDIVEQIGLIEDSTKNTKKNNFLENRDLQDATVRRLEIIGEATKSVPENIRKKYPNTEWKKIAGIRDIIIHAYFELDLDLIWNVVKNKLQDLKQQIEEILEKEFKEKD